MTQTTRLRFLLPAIAASLPGTAWAASEVELANTSGPTPDWWLTQSGLAIVLPAIILLIAATWIAARKSLESDRLDSSRNPPNRATPWPYALAILCVTLAYAARIGLESGFGAVLPPFTTYYPAIVVPAILGGFGPGLAATALATLAAKFTSTPFLASFSAELPVNRLALTLFFSVGVFISAVAGLSGRSRSLAAALRRAEAVRASEERFRLFMDNSPTITWVKDEEGRYVYLSRAFERRFGVRESDWQGKTDADLWPADIAAEFRRNDLAVLAADRPKLLAEVSRNPDGSLNHWLCNKFPFRDGSNRRYVAGIGLDITERKQAEEALRSNLEAMTRLHRLGMLSLQEGNLQPILTEIVDAAIALTGADFGNIQLLDPASGDLKIAAQRGFPSWWLDFWDSVSKGRGVCGTALENGTRVIVEDVEQSPIFRDRPELEMQRKAGIRGVQSTPLLSRSGQVLGMFSTHYREPCRFDERVLTLLDLLARQASDMIERKRSELALESAREELEHHVETRTFELIRSTELAKAERQRFYDVLETLPVYVCLLTPDHRMPFANRTFREWFGYQPNRKCFELLFDRNLPCENCQTFDVLRTQRSRQWEWVGPNGRCYDIFDFPFTDTDGSPLILEMGIDITDRKQAERMLQEFNDTLEQRVAERAEQLRRSQEDLDRAQSVGQIGWWRLDTLHNILTWSAENYRIFGIPEGQQPLTYETFLSCLHPDDREAVDRQWKLALRGEPYDIEHRILVDGNVKWVRERAYLETDEAGALLGGFGITQDITGRKLAEEALLRSEARWNAAIENFAEGAIIATEDEQLLYWNPAAREMHGFTRPDEGGEVLEDVSENFQLWTTDGRERLELDQWPMRRIKRGETLRDLELLIRRPDQGWEKVFSYSGTLVETGGGERLIFLTCRDLTELRRAEQALCEADRRKTEFLAILSHELRNPLAPIRNAVDILKHRAPPDPQLRIAQDMIDRQLNHMVRLIDDLLDVSRITRDRLILRKETVELSTIIDNAAEATRPGFNQAGHALTVTLPPQAIYLDADPVRLTQVFVNLLNNACKYTEPPGSIKLDATLHGETVEVSVRDNGIGIPAESIPLIFEMFSQAAPGLKRSQGGLGIGLALTKGLVQMHGGTIEARSAGLGQGSEFIVRLPILPALPVAISASLELPDESRPITPLRVLLADDYRDITESLSMVLSMRGYTVATAYDGEEAVEVAARFGPDVILLDIGMPKLDGLGACRRIRNLGGQPRPRIYALTGWGQDVDLLKSDEAGFDGHLVKPVDPADLLRLLEASSTKGQ